MANTSAQPKRVVHGLQDNNSTSWNEGYVRSKAHDVSGCSIGAFLVFDSIYIVGPAYLAEIKKYWEPRSIRLMSSSTCAPTTTSDCRILSPMCHDTLKYCIFPH